MKLLDRLGEWLWHNSFEKALGWTCATCLQKQLAEKIPKQLPAPKKRYGTPQDYIDAKDFIDSL
jgi:hypothetical protein